MDLGTALGRAAVASPFVVDADGRGAATTLALQAPAERMSSRADAVLAQALLPQFQTIQLSQGTQWLRSEDWQRKFEELQRRLQQEAQLRGTTLASSMAAVGGLSIGYVIWLVRGGVLMSSMLSAIPAWQMVDPLPVLASSASARRGQGAGVGPAPADDDDDVEQLFDRRGSAKDHDAPDPLDDAPQTLPGDAADRLQPPHEDRPR